MGVITRRLIALAAVLVCGSLDLGLPWGCPSAVVQAAQDGAFQVKIMHSDPASSSASASSFPSAFKHGSGSSTAPRTTSGSVSTTAAGNMPSQLKAPGTFGSMLRASTRASDPARSRGMGAWSANNLSTFSIAVMGNGDATGASANNLPSLRSTPRPPASHFGFNIGRSSRVRRTIRNITNNNARRGGNVGPLQAALTSNDFLVRSTISLGSARDLYRSATRQPNGNAVGVPQDDLSTAQGRFNKLIHDVIDTTALVVDGSIFQLGTGAINLPTLTSDDDATSIANMHPTMATAAFSNQSPLSVLTAQTQARATRANVPATGRALPIANDPPAERQQHQQSYTQQQHDPATKAKLVEKKLFYANIKNSVKTALIPGYSSMSQDELRQQVQMEMAPQQRQWESYFNNIFTEDHPSISKLMEKKLFYAAVKDTLKRLMLPGYSAKSRDQLRHQVQADIDKEQQQQQQPVASMASTADVDAGVDVNAQSAQASDPQVHRFELDFDSSPATRNVGVDTVAGVNAGGKPTSTASGAEVTSRQGDRFERSFEPPPKAGSTASPASDKRSTNPMKSFQAQAETFLMNINPFGGVATKEATESTEASGKGNRFGVFNNFGGNNNNNNKNDDGGDDEDDVKGTKNQKNEGSQFDMAQRIESTKAAAIGGVGGAVGATPIIFIHHALLSITGSGGLPQWEFATDMSAVQAALFALVYRYAVREGDNNPMLNQGVIGAFVLTRTLANVQTSPTCSALPLSCGEPLEYLDWGMLSQIFVNGVESAVLFGAAALALEIAFRKGFLSKFD